nr:MFS transporter [Salinispora arenicola]
MTTASSRVTWQVYLLALTSFLVGTSEYVIAGLLDVVAADLGVTVSTAGQLITLFSLTYAVGTPIALVAVAKTDRRTLLIGALGLFVASNVASFLVEGFWPFVVARVFMALAAGVAVVTALTLAMKIAPAERAGRAIATVVTGFTASLILGVPAGRLVAEWFSWQTVFLGIAVATLLAAGTLRYALPPVGGDRPVPVSRQLALLKNPAIVRGLSITFFWLGGYSVAYTYLSPYLIEVSGVPTTLISGALLAFGIASLVGSKAGGFLTDRRGVLPTLLGGLGLHLAALVALSFVSGSMILVLAVLVTWSVAAWSTGPTQQFHLATIEPEASGILLGLNQSMMQLAMAAGAALGGLAVAGLTLESVSWIGAAGVAVAIAITIMGAKAGLAARTRATSSVDSVPSDQPRAGAAGIGVNAGR